jgi:hypothetical protein
MDVIDGKMLLPRGRRRLILVTDIITGSEDGFDLMKVIMADMKGVLINEKMLVFEIKRILL